MKMLIKKIIPKSLIRFYHIALAILARIIYANPSGKMIVIGITGTNGKSTTAILIAKILEEAGNKVGVTSTALFKVAEKEWLNDKKMTMLGRFALQRLLSQMVSAGCRYAVVESSSEGIAQYRHWGINYDVAVFTNLTPEHIESHGSFENYKKAKLKLFQHLNKSRVKNIFGKLTPKTIVANIDDKHAKDFLDFPIKNKITYGLKNFADIRAEGINFSSHGLSFRVGEDSFDLKLFGRFNIYNSLSAIAVAKVLGIDISTCRQALEKVRNVPGRMEFVEAGQDFKVLVDYAPEPVSLEQLYQTIKDHKLVESGRIIHVLGSCGGGRDKARQPILGKLAAKNADIVIVTNEDPYDDDPLEIIEAVALGAEKAGKEIDKSLFKIIDREFAIESAVNLANSSDLVLLTGKGSEQAICFANGRKVPWDERKEAKKAILNKIS